ncbi:MAG: hypothetical protein Q9161_009533 [Pseudevernia consocians]
MSAEDTRISASLNRLNDIELLQDASNYQSWKRSFESELTILGLWHFIDEDHVAPVLVPAGPTNLAELKTWQQTHKRIYAILKSRCDDNARSMIDDKTNTHEAWEILKQFKPRGSGLMNSTIKKFESITLAGCDDNPQAYTNLFKKVLREFRVLPPKFVSNENWLIYHFHAGLEPVYTSYCKHGRGGRGGRGGNNNNNNNTPKDEFKPATETAAAAVTESTAFIFMAYAEQPTSAATQLEDQSITLSLIPGGIDVKKHDIVFRRQRNRLYALDTWVQAPICLTVVNGNIPAYNESPPVTALATDDPEPQINEETLRMWHSRYGHLGYQNLKKLAKIAHRDLSPDPLSLLTKANALEPYEPQTYKEAMADDYMKMHWELAMQEEVNSLITNKT